MQYHDELVEVERISENILAIRYQIWFGVTGIRIDCYSTHRFKSNILRCHILEPPVAILQGFPLPFLLDSV
jgi:hypothetical protein